MLPRNMLLPAIAVGAGWYGGAKYGAPEMLMNGVDEMVARGGDVVGALLGGDEDAPADDASS